MKHIINGIERTVERIEERNTAYCRTCGNKNAPAFGATYHYAPLRKSEGGLAIPRMTFLEHNGIGGTPCAASGKPCGAANLAAMINKKR